MGPQSFILFLIVYVLPCLSTATPRHLDRPTVTIDSGPVVGTQTVLPDSLNPVVNKFLGIRYAASPPRFSPPVSPESWSEPRDAIEYFPACFQQFSRNPEATRRWFNTPPPPESEDCLGLNVWTPAQRWNGKGWDDWKGNKDKGKAVLFWLYGGGLQFGTGSNLAYDGSSFAANQDVVLVTINYRNIAKFGGDPDRVTIFGQSAGSLSVDALVVSPPEPVTFHAAIYQSGQASLRSPSPDPYAGWTRTLNLTGCNEAEDGTACVSAVPGRELVDLISVNAVTFSPIADNITLSSTARSDRLTSTPANPQIARVPVLGGSVAEEGRIYALGFNNTAAFVAASYPQATAAQIESILQFFAIGTPGIETVYDQVSAIITHYQFQCTQSIVSKDIKQAGIPSWRYYWNASFANLQLFPGSGVYHATEIQPVFGTIDENSTTFEIELSQYVQGVWGRFARDPYAGPGWPQVPAVGSLGGGVRYDEGLQQGELLTIVPDAVVDARCAAIVPLYGSR